MKKERVLSKFEWILWTISVAIVTAAFWVPQQKDWLTLIASLIGVTSLLFIAKGKVIGQVLTVVFSVFYGVVSYFFKYYGEMATYLLMTAPVALVTVFSWLKHPYGDSGTVKIAEKMSLKAVCLMATLTIAVTTGFYFLLKALGTANLFVSTVSVATSFLACYLALLRRPTYALAYATNDVVLVVLWTLASFESLSYIPMVCCFVAFLLNDLYAFFNWTKMKRKQNPDA